MRQGMVPPDLASSDELCLPELRRLVAALRAELAELKAETILLRRENQALKDEVARLIAKYNLLSLPIVDDLGRLKGIVTVDDAMDVILPDDWKARLPRVYSHR